MKRKNLFLSLICSVVLAIALATFTVISVIPKKNNANVNPNEVVNPTSDIENTGDNNDPEPVNPVVNEDRDGSSEKPYVISDAEQFVELISTYGAETKAVTQAKMVAATETVVDDEGNETVTEKLDEEGNVVYEAAVDENGNTIYEDVLDEEGNTVMEPYHFELANDIDFSEVDYTTLFNNGKEFIGVIDGKEFALKNITIKVTKENLTSTFAYKDSEDRLVSHIAVFGNINGAKISNLSIENLSVAVDSDVYSYIKNAEYGKENGAYKEFAVAALAAEAADSEIENVNISANIDAFAYSLYRGYETVAHNALGGLVAVANNLSVKGGNVDVTINANAGKNFTIGGVAAYAYSANVDGTNVNVAISSNYTQALYVGGVFGYARDIEVNNVKVVLKADENVHTVDERANFVAGINSAGKSVDTNYTWVAGVVNILRANDETQKATISNVTVEADVDLEAIFAGVVMDVWNSADQNGESVKDIRLVNIADVVVDAKLNVLKAYGYSRDLVVANVTFSEDKLAEDGYFNIRLVGKVQLNANKDMIVASLYTLNKTVAERTIKLSDLHIIYSSAILKNLNAIETVNVNATKAGSAYASFGSVTEVE